MNSELLTIRGVGRVTASRLLEAGIVKVKEVAGTDLDRLAEVTHFPWSRAAAIRQAAVALSKETEATLGEVLRSAPESDAPEAGTADQASDRTKKATKKKAKKKTATPKDKKSKKNKDSKKVKKSSKSKKAKSSGAKKGKKGGSGKGDKKKKCRCKSK